MYMYFLDISTGTACTSIYIFIHIQYMYSHTHIYIYIFFLKFTHKKERMGWTSVCLAYPFSRKSYTFDNDTLELMTTFIQDP